MNILMVTNTYLPIVGGLELSVASFTAEYRKRGHRVVILTPEYEGSPAVETDVIRVPALKNFNGSKYSIKLPTQVFFKKNLGSFRPDVIHTHHPFLMGDTALRLAHSYNAPLIFTHHSLYEENIHWMPQAAEKLKKFIVELTTGYANLCDTVIAPSESVAELITEHGVKSPIVVIPTGVDLGKFKGTGKNFRRDHKIPEKAFVVGYVGRLAEEKNLPFLMQAVSNFLKKEKTGIFLVVGSGPLDRVILNHFKYLKLNKQLRLAGEMKGIPLIEAYQAINVFAFASHSETQGMVLSEAMAAGTPVVAIDAPGARDIVVDKVNGRLIPTEDAEKFSRGLTWVFDRSPSQRKKLISGAKETAQKYSMERSVTKALDVYAGLIAQKKKTRKKLNDKDLNPLFHHIYSEWELFSNFTRATVGAFQ